MELDSRFMANKRMPHFQDRGKGAAEDWPLETVCRWLDREGWGGVVPMFREYDIHSQRFLNLSITTLDKLIPKTLLTFSDIRRLAQSVQSLKHSGPPVTSNPGGTVSGRYMSASPAPIGPPIPIPTHITPTDADYIKVAPYIPKRTSSNKQDITKILENLNYDVPQIRQLGTSARGRQANNGHANNPKGSLPARYAPPQQLSPSEHSQSPISPLSSSSSDPETRWKIAGMRVQNRQERASQPIMEHRIQATTDADTFYGLKIAETSSAFSIKRAILEKMGLLGESCAFTYFHENGSRPDSPLTDEELVSICRSSDNNRTNRIMVLPCSGEFILSPERTTSPSVDYQRAGFHRKPSHQQLPAYHHPTSSNPPTQTSWTMPADNHDSLAPKPHGPYPSLSHSTGWTRPSDPVRHNAADMHICPAPDSHNDIFSSPQNEKAKDTSYFERDTSASTGTHPIRSRLVEQDHVSPPHADLWAVPPRAIHAQQSHTDASVSAPEQARAKASLWAVAPTAAQPPSDNHPPSAPGTQSEISLWAVPPSTLSIKSSTVNSPVQIVQPKSAPNPCLWAVPPTPATTTNNSPVQIAQQQTTPSPSLWAVPPTSVATTPSSKSPITHSPSSSLWAIPPATSTKTSTTNPPMQNTQPSTASSTASLWAVPPSKSSTPNHSCGLMPTTSTDDLSDRQSPDALPHTPSDTHSVGAEKEAPAAIEEAFKGVSLHDDAVPMPEEGQVTRAYPNHTDESGLKALMTEKLNSQNSPDTTDSRSPPSAPSEGEDLAWGERPSIERLYRDIDKYLPGHDLDTEIIVDAPPVAAPVPRRHIGHRKSVRVVANEAHHNWKLAMNMIRANKILRRKSTKMWGRTVEQVKPGAINETSPVAKHLQPAATYSNEKPAPTKMQWMRGELIGKGSFGRVYHALNVAAGEWIAVKQVDLPTTKSDMLNVQLRERVDSLYREIQLLADLDHENIVQYLGYDADQEEGHIYIFLEYVPGGSIASCLSKNGPFEEPLVMFFTRQILLGLEYLHDRNILHRDIKAGNILVDLNGCCKITDFGLSKFNGEDEIYDPNSSNSLMRGTVFWMAPEVVKGTYGAKIDIWSVGCTVIEMLTGSHPWLDLNMLAALYNLGKHKAPPLPEGISDAATDFLNQCFIINPDDRPTAADLLVHPFVRQNSSFKFKEHMNDMRLERGASQKRTQA